MYVLFSHRFLSLLPYLIFGGLGGFSGRIEREEGDRRFFTIHPSSFTMWESAYGRYRSGR